MPVSAWNWRGGGTFSPRFSPPRDPFFFCAKKKTPPIPPGPPLTTPTRRLVTISLRPLSFPCRTKTKHRPNKHRPRLNLRPTRRCWSVALDAHGNTHAAADAQRGQAFLCIAALHLEQERIQHPGARGADGVADGDGAAVDVNLLGVPAKPLV